VDLKKFQEEIPLKGQFDKSSSVETGYMLIHFIM